MKLEKRGDGSDAVPADAGVAETQKNKPVLVYLILLFAIAFALILFSFTMHQRSNAQVLQQLQSQVDTIEHLQGVEDKYQAALEKNDALNDQLTASEDALAEAEQEQQAMSLLWKLERYYTANNFAMCETLVTELEKDDLYLSLPNTTDDPAIEAPAALYRRVAESLNP